MIFKDRLSNTPNKCCGTLSVLYAKLSKIRKKDGIKIKPIDFANNKSKTCRADVRWNMYIHRQAELLKLC